MHAGLRAMLSDGDIEFNDDAIADTVDAADVIVTTNAVVELAGLIREDHTQAVVVMSNDPNAAATLRAMPVRGWGIVPPDSTPQELLAAVRAAALGLAVLPMSMTTSVLSGVAVEQVELEQPLTPREIEVLELVSRGLPSKLIARDLDVSESTIKFHLSSIYNKLGASSRTEAVSRAARLGLITL